MASLEKCRDRAGIMAKIGIEINEVVVIALDRGQHCLGNRAAQTGAITHVNKRGGIIGGKFVGQRRRPVVGIVVNDQQIRIGAMRPQCGQHRGDIFRFAERANSD